MSTDPAGERPRDGDVSAGEAASAADLDRLRHLLLGTEQDQLARLARRLNDPGVRAAETGSILAEAVRLAIARGPGLVATIAPVVEDAIQTSVRRNPARLVAAISPVMGPAIRRSITATLRDMIQSLNQMLETSMSWRGLMWRLEARRTGKPFAEVVLLHTLVYHVEQVLLIHRRTGLLLQQVVATTGLSPDPGVVSGMLTAIQDFVNESFNAGATSALDTMIVGDLAVWIEPGAQAYLAGIVRGQPPAEWRSTLQDAVARIHQEHGALLDRFDGDAAPFEACRPLLEPCLQARYVGQYGRRVSRPLVVALTMGVLLVGFLAFTSIRNSLRWSRLVDRLRAEPGLVLVTAETRSGRYVVSGLRDPLAVDPGTLQREAGYGPDDMVSRWEPYQAADPRFVLARAAALLGPPPSARLAFEGGVLTVSGTAPQAWIAESLRLARFVPGVTAVRADGLGSQERVTVASRVAAVEQRQILFAAGSAVLDAGERPGLVALAADLRTLTDAARAVSMGVHVEAAGRTDETGSDAANSRLGAARAQAVVAALVSQGVDSRLCSAVGAGPAAGASLDGEQRARKRRVEFRVQLIPAVPTAGGER